jgi:hypothetical protein
MCSLPSSLKPEALQQCRFVVLSIFLSVDPLAGTRASGLTAGRERARWHFDPISNTYLLKGYARGMPASSSTGTVGKLLKKGISTQTATWARQSVHSHGLISVNGVPLSPVARPELT